MRSRTIFYLEKELVDRLKAFVENKKGNLIYNSFTNNLFSKSYLISELLKAFFNSGLSLEDFCRKFPSIKEQIIKK